MKNGEVGLIKDLQEVEENAKQLKMIYSSQITRTPVNYLYFMDKGKVDPKQSLCRLGLRMDERVKG